MTRLYAIGLLVAALGVYAGLARPLQRETALAAEAFKGARDERREVRSRIRRLEGRMPVATPAAASAEATPGAAVRAVRRSLVRTVEEAGLSPVRLSVRPGRPPVAASVQLSAQGRFEDVVVFTGLVSRPQTGVVLQKVHLTPRPGSSASLDLDAIAVGVE